MKKSFILFLTILMVVSLFALPTFAAPAKVELQMRDIVNPDNALDAVGKTLNHQWEANVNGQRITGNQIKFMMGGGAATNNVMCFYVRFYFESDLIHEVWYRTDNGSLHIKKILPSDLIVYGIADSELALFEHFATTPRCDGTSCSWADDDLNGICDTCGVALLNFRYNSLEDYAQVHINNGQSLYTDASYWVLYRMEGDEKIYILLSNAPFEYDGSSSIIQPLTTTGTMRKSDVSLMSTGQYGGGGWSTVSGSSIEVDPYKVIDASETIEGFFPLPLHQVIQAVTEGAMMEQIPILGGKILVLIISGIGLLALLLVLILFGKLFRTCQR